MSSENSGCSLGFLVIIFITPATASDPNSVLLGPLTTYNLSIIIFGIPLSPYTEAKFPYIGMPSNKTDV